jgi:ABC-type Fe3+/spermidine/putrescine transport system ATPase subunit
MLKIENLSYKIGGFSLTDINLEITESEYFVLLGPTGSGKTTFIKCLLGLNKISRGRIFLNDRDITEKTPENRDIGFMPQNYMLFPNLNVFDNIAYGLKVKKKSADIIAAEVANILKVLGIEHIKKKAVSGLSGGEAQRVALARALITKPQLLLFDEPFSAIDQGLKNELWFEIKSIVKNQKIPAIHITHNLDEGYMLGDRLGIFLNGSLVQVAGAEKIFFNPANEQIAKFLGIGNIFAGAVAGVTPQDILIDYRGIKLIAGNQNQNRQVLAGEKIKFCIRPEAVKIIKKDVAIRTELAENIFAAKIVSSHFFYDTSILKLEIASVAGWNITAKFPVHIYKRFNLCDGAVLKIAFWKPGIIVF